MCVFIFGCGQMESAEIDRPIPSGDDSNLYKLSILNVIDNSDYYVDQKGRCDVLLQRELLVDNLSFGGIENITDFIQYCNENRMYERLAYETSISVKSSNGQFLPVWIWRDEIELDFDQKIGNKIGTTYSLREGRIAVEDGFLKLQDRVNACIKIKFHEPDLEAGFKTNILNFVHLKENEWQLVSRERINTMLGDVNEDSLGYCIDTINSNVGTSFQIGKVIMIDNEMMFNFSDQYCY